MQKPAPHIVTKLGITKTFILFLFASLVALALEMLSSLLDAALPDAWRREARNFALTIGVPNKLVVSYFSFQMLYLVEWSLLAGLSFVVAIMARERSKTFACALTLVYPFTHLISFAYFKMVGPARQT